MFQPRQDPFSELPASYNERYRDPFAEIQRTDAEIADYSLPIIKKLYQMGISAQFKADVTVVWDVSFSMRDLFGYNDPGERYLKKDAYGNVKRERADYGYERTFLETKNNPHYDTMVKVGKKMSALAATVDDDKEFKTIYFGGECKEAGPLKYTDSQQAIDTIVENIGIPGNPLCRGTYYHKPLQLLLERYQKIQGRQDVKDRKPALVIFFTDGDDTDPSQTLRVQAELSKLGVFVKFLPIAPHLTVRKTGNEKQDEANEKAVVKAQFKALHRLDSFKQLTLPTGETIKRVTDNSDVQLITNVNDMDVVSLVEELGSWMVEAVIEGILDKQFLLPEQIKKNDSSKPNDEKLFPKLVKAGIFRYDGSDPTATNTHVSPAPYIPSKPVQPPVYQPPSNVNANSNQYSSNYSAPYYSNVNPYQSMVSQPSQNVTGAPITVNVTMPPQPQAPKVPEVPVVTGTVLPAKPQPASEVKEKKKKKKRRWFRFGRR